jgi:hypothetical protein
MDEIKEALYFEEALAKEKAFEDKLDAIELMYNHWFKDRVDTISGEKPDRLHNYWMTYQANNRLSFGFLPDGDLPKIIQDECSEAFRDVYA